MTTQVLFTCTPFYHYLHVGAFVSNSRSLGVTITSVVPGDYDGDSQMDVLLTTQAPGHGKDELSVFIFWGHNQTLGELLRLVLSKIVRFLNSKYCQELTTHFYSVMIVFSTKIGISSFSASHPYIILLLNCVQ